MGDTFQTFALHSTFAFLSHTTNALIVPVQPSAAFDKRDNNALNKKQP
jgi:hypothetical protein